MLSRTTTITALALALLAAGCASSGTSPEMMKWAEAENARQLKAYQDAQRLKEEEKAKAQRMQDEQVAAIEREQHIAMIQAVEDQEIAKRQREVAEQRAAWASELEARAAAAQAKANEAAAKPPVPSPQEQPKPEPPSFFEEHKETIQNILDALAEYYNETHGGQQ